MAAGIAVRVRAFSLFPVLLALASTLFPLCKFFDRSVGTGVTVNVIVPECMVVSPWCRGMCRVVPCDGLGAAVDGYPGKFPFTLGVGSIAPVDSTRGIVWFVLSGARGRVVVAVARRLRGAVSLFRG